MLLGRNGQRFLDSVLRRPRLWSLAALLLMGLLTVGLVKPGLTFQVYDVFFVEDDPVLETYKRIPELFGEDRYVIVTVTVPDGERTVFNQATFELVEQLSHFLDEQKAVVRVRGLTRYQRIVPSEDMVRSHDVWPLAPPYETFDLLERDLMKDELVTGGLVTRDGKTAVIAALVERVEDQTTYPELTTGLEAFIAKAEKKGHRIRIAGETIFGSWMVRASQRDFSWMAPAMLIAIFLPLGLLFRRWVGVVLPAVAIIGSTVATMGGLALAGMNLNILNFLLPVILLPMGIADCVHMVSEFFRFYRKDEKNAREAAREATVEVFWPVVFTTFTTAAGFLGLCTSQLAPIRELGLQAAFGVTLLLILTVVLLPAVLSRYKGSEWRPHSSENGFMTRVSEVVPRFCHRWRWHIIVVSVVASLACLPLLGRLRAESDSKTYFRESSTEFQQLVEVDRLLGGTIPVEMIIDTGEPDGIKNPATLRSLRNLSEYLASTGRGAPPRTLVDFLEATNEALTLYKDPREPERGYRTLPPTSDQIAQLLLVYESLAPREAVDSMSDSTGRYLRLTFPLPMLPSGEYAITIGMIRSWLAAHEPGLDVTLTGAAVGGLVLDRYIIDTTHSSFLVGFGIVLLFILVILRSFRLWLLSILPNVVPLILVGGALALLDIPLDAGTTMVASITAGLVVDDTIHFMTRLRHHIRRGAGPIETVAACYREVGTAMLLTSVVLILGFSVYLLGSFVPNIRFGMLACLIIFLALVAELVMVPALLFVAWPRRLAAEAADEAEGEVRLPIARAHSPRPATADEGPA